MKCPKCGNKHVVKFGFKMTKDGRRQRLQCQNCGYVFFQLKQPA